MSENSGKLKWIEVDHANCRDFRIEQPTLAAGVEQRPITGALWLPDGHAPGAPLMLFGHGASGDRYQMPIPHLARRFVEVGVACLALDGPVHGLRQVGPGGREAFAEEMKRPAFLDDMVGDWLLAMEVLTDVAGIGGGRMGYFGLSMGSIFGVPVVAARDDVDVACLGLLGTSGVAIRSESRLANRLQEDAAKIDQPVLFLMQLEDELFDRLGYLDLFDRLASDDKRLHANPGLHPEVPAEEVDAAFDFLNRRLQGEVLRRVMNPLAE